MRPTHDKNLQAVHGLLPPKGFDKRAFLWGEAADLLPCQIALEVKDIRAIRDEFGKPFRNVIHSYFGIALARTLYAGAWRLYQYEFAAQSADEPAAHRAMGRIEGFLHEHPMTVYRPESPDIHLRIGFVYSLGTRFTEAYEGIIADRRHGEMTSNQVLLLPDGSCCDDPLLPGSRHVSITHLDEHARQARAASRRDDEELPVGVRVQVPESDGTLRTLTPTQTRDYFDERERRRAARPRWVIPWQADTSRPTA